MIEEDLGGCNSGAVRFVSGDVYRRRIRCCSEKSEKRVRNKKIKECMRICKMEKGYVLRKKLWLFMGNFQ